MKKIINRTLGLAGLRLERVRRRRPGEMVVRVGKYDIRMAGRSLLPDIYRDNPEYSGDLGRLALACSRKYPGSAVLDVGANYGDTVAIIKSHVDAPVVCIEGDSFSFNLLKENIKQFRDTRAFHYYLGERSEKISARIDKGGWNATLVPVSEGGSQHIELLSLDDLVQAIGLQDVDFKILKVDTEGFDCRIIRGARNFIAKKRPVIAFEYNRHNMNAIGESGFDTLLSLKAFGYDRILFYDGQARLLLGTSLSEEGIIRDLHDYADGRGRAIYNYDICMFHGDDSDLADVFECEERRRRDQYGVTGAI